MRTTTKCIALLAFVLAAAFPAFAGEADPILLRAVWNSPNDRSCLDLAFAGNPIIVALPGENLEISAQAAEGPCRVTLLKNGQPFCEDAKLPFTAPEKPGAYYIPLVLKSPTRSRASDICVVVPYRASGKRTQDGSIDLFVDGQEVGNYRTVNRSGNAKVKENPESYQPPVWWFRMTPQNMSFEVAPGLPVSDLVAPAEDSGLRHTDTVPVMYPMWLAVGKVRAALSAKGIPARTMKLISVFRTPPYNRGIGSNAFGRHIYGDAFDFYIDPDGKGKAADLNRDGKLDRRDAYPVVAIIEDLMADGVIPMGGVGVYNTIGGDHEVTMHVDLRGHRSTWGYLYGPGGKRSDFSWQSRRFADLDRQDEAEAAARAAREGRKYYPPRREPLQ